MDRTMLARVMLTAAFVAVTTSVSSGGQTSASSPQPVPQNTAPAPTAAPTEAAPSGQPGSQAARESILGKAPPPITVAKWVKGEPLIGFEKGKVYVVDFWATWCGPCKAAIPHLSKLAQEHKGKVEVIGVSISEKQKDADDTSYIDLVQKFVDKQGERMSYRVAVDTPDKKMHASWFKPTGLGGIPTAYIIDQNGLVAWIGIGSPAVVERIVGEVLAGTFDIKKEQERQAREETEAAEKAKDAIAKSRAAGNRTDEKFPGYADAMKAGNTAAALEALNQAFKANPELEYEASGYQTKIQTLMRRAKDVEVEGYLKDLLARKPGEGDKNPSQHQLDDMLAFYSACLVRLDDEEQRYDSTLILDATKRSAAAAKPDTRWSFFTKMRLGWAYFHAGDKDKAIVAMQDASDTAKRLKDKFEFGDAPEQCEDALNTFKKASAKSKD